MFRTCLLAVSALVPVLCFGDVARAECDPSICVGNPCTIDGTHLLDDGCTLDFGVKTVTIADSASLRAAVAGGSFRVRAGNLIVRGALEASGGSPSSAITIDVAVSGDFRTESGSGSTGVIDVKANGPTYAGSIRILAGNEVQLLGREVNADGGTADFGGVIEIAAGSIVLGGSLHADGSSGGDGGLIFLTTTAGDLSIHGPITAHGNGTGTFGGEISIYSVRELLITAPIRADGGRTGDGGGISMQAERAAIVRGNLTVKGAGAESSGGSIELEAAEISSESAWSADGGSIGSGGDILLTSNTGGITTTSASTMSATAGAGGLGGIIEFDGRGDVSVGGDLTATASGMESDAGVIVVAAGPDRSLSVSSTLDARSTAANDASDGFIVIGPACSVRLTGTFKTRNSHLVRGVNEIAYRGSLDATGATLLADDEQDGVGGNRIACRCADLGVDGICGAPLRCETAPVLSGATFDPAPIIAPRALGPCTGCPNGILDAPGEQCDDDNVTSGDGCDPNCTFPGCGNGVVAGSEECEDGNAVDGDGCDTNCTTTRCGNAIATDGEECDDGNLTNTDGCDVECRLCGNGVVARYEECEDSNGVDGDGCDSNCTSSRCGNGVAAGSEACDDGNSFEGDGCDTNCTISGCGNGIVGGFEECEDGNAIDGDGCDTNCTVTRCGNGIVTDGEACDDGDVDHLNCCTSTCEPNPGGLCEDGNYCTNDACTAAGTCQGTPNSERCDDYNPCTDNDQCREGNCAGTQIAGCSTCCVSHLPPGCDVDSCAACVCGFDPYCCGAIWDEWCVSWAFYDCRSSCPAPCGDLEGPPTPTPTFTPVPPTVTSTVTDTPTPDVTPTPGSSAASTPTAVVTTPPTPVCGSVPQIDCRTPAVGEKALIVIKDKTPDDRDVLLWKWIKGAVTTKAEFGNPLVDETFELCIYDGTPALVSSATAPAGGLCNGVKPKPCWAEDASGFKYNDKDLTPDGIQKLALKQGLEPGKAKIVLKAKGMHVDVPPIPIAQPLAVQLKSSSGRCWEARYGPPAVKNTAGPPPLFKDKAD